MATPVPGPSALLKADPKVTLTFQAEKNGMLRVSYQGWEDAKVFRPGEAIEFLVVDGQVHAYRRGEPGPTEAPPIDPYESYGGDEDE